MGKMAMLAQTSLVLVSLFTSLTLECQSIPLVLLHVLTKVGPRDKLFLTDRTFIRLFS